jgi:hypothetical protein
MIELPTGFLLAFLLPFHVGGGVAIGVALRRIFQDGFALSKVFRQGFLLVWGSMFGGIPLAFGISEGVGWLVVPQLVAFLGTIALVTIFHPWLRELYSQPGMFVGTFGLVFLVIGIGVGFTFAGDGDSVGLLLALVFGGIGAIVTAVGIWLLLRRR